MANPILDTLTPYVDEHKLDLIRKVVLTAPSLKYFTIQTGVKHTAAINILDNQVEFDDGSACGFDAKGSDEFSQRLITVGTIKVNKEFCPKQLLGFYTQNQVNVAAGKETLGSFEADFIESNAAAIKKNLEMALYQGDTASSNPNLNKFDGLLKLLNAESEVIKYTAPAGESVYDSITNIYLQIPNATYKRNGETLIIVGTDAYRQYINELVKSNLYHYNPADGADGFKIPGTNVRVVGVDGLDDSKGVVAINTANNYYGTDLEGDFESFDFWFSKDDDIFKLKACWNSGVQVAFPNEVVLGTLA